MADKLNSTEVDPSVIGYIYTEWDCPNCNETCRVEGDANGDDVPCDCCGFIADIREVR